MTAPPIAEPIHTVTIGEHSLRFYRSPLTELDGKPDLPWVSMEDLHLVSGYPRAARRELSRQARGHAEWQKHMRSLSRPGGAVEVIMSWPMAQGASGAAVEVGCAPPGLERELQEAGAAALTKQVNGLPPAERTQFALRAFLRSNGMDESRADSVRTMIDQETGEPVLSFDEVTAALGIDDEPPADAIIVPAHRVKPIQ